MPGTWQGSPMKRGATAVLAAASLLVLAAAAAVILKENSRTSGAGEAGRLSGGGSVCEEITRIELGINSARGVALSADGLIAVVGDRDLLLIRSAGGPPIIASLEEEARCVAFGGDRVYVGMSRHVEVFDAEGRRLEVWAEMGQKTLLTSIAADEDAVFVADAGSRMVWVYDTRGRLGSFIESEGEPFIVPSPYFDVALGPDGALWVGNPGRHRLQRHDRDDGRIAASWGRSSRFGSGFSGCCNPAHFAVLSDGCFVTSEKGLFRVRLHDPEGRVEGHVVPPSAVAVYSEGLDVAVDSRDFIYLLEAGSVRVFAVRDEE